MTGDLRLAIHYLQLAIDSILGPLNNHSTSVALQNLADNQRWLCLLRSAVATAAHAVLTAWRPRDDRQSADVLTTLGEVLSLRGSMEHAATCFALARSLESGGGPIGMAGIRWARFLLRIGETKLAVESLTANADICRASHWNDETARCEMAIGALLEPAAGRDYLDSAEVLIRTARHTKQLPEVLLAQAESRRRAGEFTAA